MPGHNHIYDRLVHGPDDAIGSLAYCLYKKSKQEYCRAFEATHGHAPTLSDLVPFHQANESDSQIDSYLASGRRLAQEFLSNGLAKQLTNMEDTVRESVLSQRIGRVEGKLDEAKSGRRWAKDIGTSILVNVLTVIVVGVIALGSREYSSLTTAIETRVSAGQR
jgi:hypothetical protein